VGDCSSLLRRTDAPSRVSVDGKGRTRAVTPACRDEHRMYVQSRRPLNSVHRVRSRPTISTATVPSGG